MRSFGLALGLGMLVACAEDPAGVDAGLPLDADPAVDLGVDAAAPLDSGLDPDAGPVDMGATDATPSDTGVTDTGVPIDAGLGDAGLDDAGLDDAGSSPDGGAGAIDPTVLGAFPLTTVSDTVQRNNRSTPVFAHVPTKSTPSPLIVFVPGFRLDSVRYEAFCEHLASHGFVVVRADPPDPLIGLSHVEMRDDTSAVIDWAIARFGASLTDQVGVSGHSLGGKVTTMVAGADERVGALLAIDPVNGGNPITGYSAELPDIVPDVTQTLAIFVGFLGETTNASGSAQNCAPADQNYVTFYDGSAMATSAYEWTFENADHMDFVSDTAGCGFTCTACPDGGADEAIVQAGMKTLAVAFFRRHFQQDATMDAYLSGASLPPGVLVRAR